MDARSEEFSESPLVMNRLNRVADRGRRLDSRGAKMSHRSADLVSLHLAKRYLAAFSFHFHATVHKRSPEKKRAREPPRATRTVRDPFIKMTFRPLIFGDDARAGTRRMYPMHRRRKRDKQPKCIRVGAAVTIGARVSTVAAAAQKINYGTFSLSSSSAFYRPEAQYEALNAEQSDH